MFKELNRLNFSTNKKTEVLTSVFLFIHMLATHPRRRDSGKYTAYQLQDTASFLPKDRVLLHPGSSYTADILRIRRSAQHVRHLLDI